jgi:hypothetical protein
MTRMIAMAAILTILLSVAVHAGSNPDAKVAVHVIPHGSRSCTKNFPSITECGNIIYTDPTGDVDAFPVFFSLVEYAGLAYAVTWPGTYSTVFSSCSDLTVGEIVYTGDPASHAWTTCQQMTVAIPSYLWISEPSPSMICVVAHPDTTIGMIQIGDCTLPYAQTDSVPAEKTYCAGIMGADGEYPCENATEPTTWGGIKRIFR